MPHNTNEVLSGIFHQTKMQKSAETDITPAFQYAIATAAAQSKPPKSHSELQEYLVEQGFADKIVIRTLRKIWPAYEKLLQSSRVHQEPSPPNSEQSGKMSDAGSANSNVSMLLKPHISIILTFSNQSLSGNHIQILLDGGTDSTEPIGCTFVSDCVESVISEDTVGCYDVPIPENGTVNLRWKRLNMSKTFRTICKIVPSDDIPDDNVKFGTGYSKGLKQQEIQFAPAKKSRGELKFPNLSLTILN